MAIIAGLKRGGALTHLDVIASRFQCQERKPVSLTTLRKQAFCFRLHLTREYLSAILWYPYQVIRNRMWVYLVLPTCNIGSSMQQLYHENHTHL